MANDPMTLSSVVSVTVRDGLAFVSGLATGPNDYDKGTGAVMDISAYLSTCPGGVHFGGCTAVTDALVYPTWIDADATGVSTGVVVFTWDLAIAADAVFAEVKDGTDANLDNYVWHWSAWGEPA